MTALCRPVRTRKHPSWERHVPPMSRAEADLMWERLLRASFERLPRHWAPPSKSITIRPSISPWCIRAKMSLMFSSLSVVTVA